MERPRRTYQTTILIGIGLILVGLLSGILLMLFVIDQRPAARVSEPLVETVKLGRTNPPRPIAMPDSAEVGIPVPADVLTLNRLFKDVATQVTPAVVYIQVEGQASDAPRDWFHNFEEDSDLNERFLREMPRQSVGSGVIISDEGYIVTNHHVVEKASNILVTLDDKRQFKARVVGIDASTDLAVIQINKPTHLPVVALGDSDELEVGEWVLAVGNPFRLTSTVTAGIVSALGRQVNIIEDRFGIEDFIQTDAAINPGNSGGALVNLQGELVGISTAIATESGSYEGYGFAVPVNLMTRVARDLIAYGEVRRGFLGVEIRDIDAGAAQELGLEQIGGVYLNRVERGGAAYQGGLRRGDVVLSLDGRAVNAPNELQSAIARHRPGDHLDVEIWRRGQRKQLQVQLLAKDDPAFSNWFAQVEPEPERYPELEPRTPSTETFQLEDWGIGIRELTSRERDAFDTERGVYLAYVANGSVAAAGGLPRDVVLLRIGDEVVSTLEDAIRELGIAAESSDTVLLRVKQRNGLAAFYELEVPAVE